MNENNFKKPKIPNSFDSISKSMKETQELIRNNMPKLNIPDIDISKITMPDVTNMKPVYPKIDTSELDRVREEIAKQKQEELKRKIENNENLKNLAIYNQQIVDYNQQLINLNEEILKKINIVSYTMDNIIENVGEENKNTKEFSEEQTKLLLQLINIMESKDDKGKLRDFLKGLTGDVAAGLITGYLQFKLGLS